MDAQEYDRCLSALEQENAKLREQLRVAYPLSDTLQHWKQRAEAAEAKLKAASEQEPVAWAREWEGDESDLGNMIIEFNKSECDDNPNWFPLYAAPIPPVDVHKLRREIESVRDSLNNSRKTIDSLKRKLAEQQATVQNFFGMYARELPDVGEELNTLLAQAREEGRLSAVPEGWQVVPKEPMFTGMSKAGMDRANALYPMVPALFTNYGVMEIYVAMLAAAPKPEAKEISNNKEN